MRWKKVRKSFVLPVLFLFIAMTPLGVKASSDMNNLTEVSPTPTSKPVPSVSGDIDNRTEVSIGRKHSGETTESDKKNSYKIDIPSSGTLRFDVVFNTSNLEIFVSHVDLLSAGELSDDPKYPGRSTFEWNEELKKGVGSLTLELHKGTYGFSITTWGANESAYGGYVFTPVFTPAELGYTEQNNSFDTSTAISLNSTTKGHFTCNRYGDDDYPYYGNENYYKIELPSAGTLKLDIKFYSEYLDIQIFNSNKVSLFKKKEFDWSKSYKMGWAVFNQELKKGTYYLKLSGVKWIPYGDNYNVVVENYFGLYHFKTTFTELKNPNKVKLTSVKSIGKLKALVKWNRVKNVSGYQITYSTNKSFKGKKSILISDTKNASNLSNLINKKTYYVKVRAYKTHAGKKYYGGYGNVKKVIVKK